MPGLNVAQGISYHDTVSGACFREVTKRLLKQTRQGLSAVALALLMRADVDCIEPRAVSCQLLSQLLVYLRQALQRIQTQGHAALVGNHDYLAARAIQFCQRVFYARQKMKFLPAGDVL